LIVKSSIPSIGLPAKPAAKETQATQ